MTQTVLAYIDINNQYLLLYRNKKKNDINKEKWIGVGGHIEKGETPEDALIREIKEETNYDVISYQKRGVIYFSSDGFSEVMHLYTVNKVKGQIRDCDEGELKFFDKDKIFGLPMWEGDKIFLGYLLNNEPYFELRLDYKNDHLINFERLK